MHLARAAFMSLQMLAWAKFFVVQKSPLLNASWNVRRFGKLIFSLFSSAYVEIKVRGAVDATSSFHAVDALPWGPSRCRCRWSRS